MSELFGRNGRWRPEFLEEDELSEEESVQVPLTEMPARLLEIGKGQTTPAILPSCVSPNNPFILALVKAVEANPEFVLVVERDTCDCGPVVKQVLIYRRGAEYERF